MYQSSLQWWSLHHTWRFVEEMLQSQRDVQTKQKGEEDVSPMAQRQNVVVMRDVSMESKGGVCVTHGAKVKRCRLWKDVKSLREAIIVGGVCITHDVIIYEICTLPINITSTFLNPPQRKITHFAHRFGINTIFSSPTHPYM